MSYHNPLALAAAPPLQFHLAGLLQGTEVAGFTVPMQQGREAQGWAWGCTGVRHTQSLGKGKEVGS